MMAISISKILARNLRQRGSVCGSNLSDKWVPAVLSPVHSNFSTSAHQSQEKEGRSVWAKLLLFVPGGIAFGLGTWQVFRRQEKIEMLEYRQNRLGMEPLQCNEITPSSASLDSLEFRRVQCKGVFDEEKTIHVGPRSRSISGVSENGYYLVTPFKPIPENSDSVQSPILVNRGWVPRSWRDKQPEVDKQPANPSSSPTQEIAKSSWWRFWSKNSKVVEEDVPAISPVEVIGVVRGSEKPSIFVPANDPASGQWFYVDVPAIAKACGLPEDTLYIEDVNEKVDPSNPYPIPKDSNTLIRSSVMPQDHLNYILTCWLWVSTFVFYILQSTYGIHQILLMVFHPVV